MSNIFLIAKKIRKQHPKLSWQQCVARAGKQKKSAGKRKSVGAYKVIEKGEKKSTPAKKTVRVVRSKKGLFKGYQKVTGVAAGALGEINKQLARKKSLQGTVDRITSIKPKERSAAIRSDLVKAKREISAVGRYITQLKKSI